MDEGWGTGGTGIDTHILCIKQVTGFSWWASSEESACSAGDQGSIPGWGGAPGGGNGNPLPSSRLENPTEGCGGLQSMGLQRVGHDC